MKYRILGKTNIKVSEIGFGCWGIGGESKNTLSYGPRNDNDSILALERAFELGITFYDTSCSYGDGHSEELLGKVFKEKRDKVIIATKAGYINNTRNRGINQDFSKLSIKKSIQESLIRLKTSYIDILQLHDCAIHNIINNEKLFSFLIECKAKGIIRAIGFAGKLPTETIEALNIFNFDVVQSAFSLVDMRVVDTGLLNLLKLKSLGFIARTPLAFGIILGKKNFAQKDHRKRFSYQQINKWNEAFHLYNHNLGNNLFSFAQKAISFPLSFQETSTVNVGIDFLAQVEENANAVECSKLSEFDIKSVFKIYKENYEKNLVYTSNK